ncbi:hypothetical protein [Lysobacter sp. Hz 25]|uniref:hypothetical protein n=1 Tax=Lysobacter sp. Hz 25 TaxID=3383698 RepID=UPI0038D42772
MNSVARVCCLVVAFALARDAIAADGRELYPSFVVHPHEGTRPEFKFSEAYATSASPVVITVVGRKMKKSDSEYRTSLQRHWLSVHLPEQMEIVMREQVLCDFKTGTDASRCDRYLFEGGGKTLEYYFYLNNWR